MLANFTNNKNEIDSDFESEILSVSNVKEGGDRDQRGFEFDQD